MAAGPSELKVEIRRTLGLALPVILTQLSLMSMGFVDAIMVGWLGPLELGAVSLGRSVFFTLSLVLLGCIAGTEPLIGQAFGAGRHRDCGRALWHGFALAALLGVPLTVVMLDLGWLFELTGQAPETASAAAAYLGWNALATVPFLVFGALRCFLNSVGHPHAVLGVALVANVVNVLANYGFIFGYFGLPAMGIEGAGLATFLSTVAMAAMTAWLVLGGRRFADMGLAPARPTAAELRRIIGIGLPIGLQIGAEVGVFSAAAFLMGRLGEAPLAAHTVALTLASATFMVPLGTGVAASIRVSQLIGAGRPDDAARAGKVALAIGASFMTVSALALCAFPEAFVRIFNDEKEVLALGVVLVRIAGLFQVSDGLQAVASGCLRGAADTRTPMVANIVAHWFIGLPLGWVLAFHTSIGAPGIWIGLTTSLVLVAATLTLRFLRGRWRRLGSLVGPAVGQGDDPAAVGDSGGAAAASAASAAVGA